MADLARAWDEAQPISDAEWESAEPVADAPADPGLGDAIARGIGRGGLFRFNDEFVGAARALGPQGGSGQDFANDAPIVEPVAGDTLGERYRTARDEERAADKAAIAAHPTASFVSELAGGAAVGSRLPFPAPRGAGLMSRVAAGAKGGAPAGAAFGLGGSEAETVGGQALDAGLGAVGGAAAGAAIPAAFAGLGKAAGPVAEWLRKVAINSGRKVLTGNSGSISVKKPLSPEAVRAALDEGAIRPFGTTQGAAERLGSAREAVGDLYGDLIASLEAQGVTGPNAAKLAGDLIREAEKRSASTFTSVDPAPGAMRDIAYELLGLQQGMHGLRRVAPKALTGEAPGGDIPLTVAEGLRRKLQQAAQSEYVKEGRQSLGGEAKVDIARLLRQAIEDEVAAQAPKAPAEAAAFEPVKRRLGAVIEASDAADKAAARISRNRGISLTDTIAGAAGMSQAGIPGAAAMAVANKLGRTRGPATVSWLADRAANAVEPLATEASPAAVQAAEVPTLDQLVQFLRSRYGLGPAAAGAEDGAP